MLTLCDVLDPGAASDHKCPNANLDYFRELNQEKYNLDGEGGMV